MGFDEVEETKLIDGVEMFLVVNKIWESCDDDEHIPFWIWLTKDELINY
jgi:hypothetical protein